MNPPAIAAAGAAFPASGSTVSVIVPTRNRRGLLERAVRSVLAQTHRELELIVVDDGSDDETPAFLADLRRADPRVRVIRNDTCCGGGAARNAGLAAAGGFYTAFLDDDDEWMPEKLERQLPFAESYTIVGCLSRSEHTRRPPRAPDNVPRLTPITLDDVYFDHGRLSPSVMLTRTDHLRAIGGFDATLAASQGRDLFVRLVHAFGPAVMLETELARHYQRHGQHRITDSPAHLLGGWQEFRKHAAQMPPRLRRWRRYVLCLKEARRAERAPERLRWLWRALLSADPRRPVVHAKALLMTFAIRRPAGAPLGAA